MRRPALALLALSLSGCAILGPIAGVDPLFFRPPTGTDPSPELVVEGGVAPASGGGSTGRSAPTPTPSASPSAEPKLLAFDAFIIKAHPAWRIEQSQLTPPALILRAADGAGVLRVSSSVNVLAIEALQELARQEAGPGLITVQSVTLDELRGYLVGANRDTADGRRYVVERGFRYRDQHWRIVTEWDKKAPGVDRVITDLEAMLRSFRWM